VLYARKKNATMEKIDLKLKEENKKTFILEKRK